MKLHFLLIFCFFFLFPTEGNEESAKEMTTDEMSPLSEPDTEKGLEDKPDNTASKTAAEETKEKLSDQIRKIIRNYKEYGEVIIPGVELPDPMSVPDMKKSISGSTVNCTNVRVHGLSKFSVDHVNTDIDKKQFFVALKMKQLIVLGNYSLKFFLNKVSGPFNITLFDVESTGAAELGRDEEGNLQATAFEMDMSFQDAAVDFKNLGLVSGLLQGFFSTAGSIIFDAVKPTLISQIRSTVQDDINVRIKGIGKKFASDDNQRPLDMAVAEGRKYVKFNGYDPYHLRDYVLKENIFTINISHFWIAGLSRFYRVGEVSLSMDSGTMQLGFRLVTERLNGNCRWLVRVTDQFWKTGVTNFTISSVQVKVAVNQSLDVSQHPVLHDLDLHVGTLQITVDQTGKLDLFIEAVVNSLPVMLRHTIVDALEEPIKEKAQEILNTINVEEIMNKHLPELDEMDI